MANRTIFVTLRARVGEYNSAFEQASKKTRELGSESEKLAQKKEAFNLLGQGALAMGTAIAAGVGLAVARFAEFDQQMSFVQAATHETTQNMGLLRDAALEAGASTVFSATEAAQAIEELAKAGVATEDILGGGLDGALDLAAAGGLDVARAAEIAAVALKTFGLEGRDMSHVSDLLAAGAGKAMGDVEDLSQALAQGGQVASQTGLSIEETTAGLAAFASQGLLGSDAGTSFKSMLQRLTPQSNEAKKAMDDLGISAYDANGQFIGLADFAGNLQESLRDLTPEQRNSATATIFGSDAVRAATVLYSEGEQGIRDWTDAVDDQGYAAETAATRLDNLAGDVEALGGAFDTALIQSGSAANDTLRFLVQTVTDGVEAFTKLPEPVQGGALAVGALAGAASLAAGGFLLAVPKVAEFNSALATMGPGAQRAGRAAVALGKGVGLIAGLSAAVLVLDNLASAGDDAARGLEETTQALVRAGGPDALFADMSSDVSDFSSALELLVGSSLNSNMERFGSTLNGIVAGGQLSDQVQETRTQFATMGEALAAMVESGNAAQASTLFQQMSIQAAATGVSTEQLTDLMPAYQEALAGVTNEQTLAAGAAAQQEAGLAALAGVAVSSGEEIEELSDTIRGFASVVFGSRDAARDFEAAIDAVSESIDANGRSLDITTEAGRSNEQTLDDLAVAAKENAAAIYERTRSEDEAKAAVQRGREELVRALEQYGITGEAAELYANELGLIPDNIYTAIEVNTTDATRQVDNWIMGMNGKRVNIAMGAGGSGGITSANGNLVAYANGGFTSGIYKGRPGAIHKFAEPETRWEAYISGKPGMEQRNIGIALESLDRLGYGEAMRHAPIAPQIFVQAAPSGPQGLNLDVTQNIQGPNADQVARKVMRELEHSAQMARLEWGTRTTV